MKSTKYSKNLFEKGFSVFLADEVKLDTIICLSKNKYFYVRNFDKEFINDEVAKLYNDNDKVLPEHTVITFYDEDDNEIYGIPGNAEVIVYDRLDGKHNINPEFPIQEKLQKNQIEKLVLENGLTITDLIDVVVEINGIIGVGLISLGDSIQSYCHSKIK